MADVREMRIFEADQIIVHADLPGILKAYSKEVIRNGPDDMIKFSRQYFEEILKAQGYDFNQHKPKVEAHRTFWNDSKAKIEDFYKITERVYECNLARKISHGINLKQGFESAIVQRAIPKVERFELKERIEEIAAFNHNNIAKTLEVFEDEKNVYIVGECLKGDDILNSIWQRGFFSEGLAANIVKQVLESVSYLHSKGYSHTQLYPTSIQFVTMGSQQIKVTGMDSAKTLITNFQSHINEAQILSSEFYLSPEIIRGQWDLKNDEWSVGALLYQLLTGCLPFQGDSIDDTLLRIKGNKIGHHTTQLQAVSDEAKDLISKLLAYQPSDRISADEALRHPWFKLAKQGKLDTFSLPGALIQLKSYYAGSKLKQAILEFVQQQLLWDHELEDLKNLFKTFDKNSNGKLCRQELITAFRECKGINYSEKEIDDIIARVDADGSSDIDYNEFIRSSIATAKVISEQRLQIAFDLFDKNGDQQVSVREIKEILTPYQAIDVEAINKIMKEIDKSLKSTLRFTEFCAFIKKAIDLK